MKYLHTRREIIEHLHTIKFIRNTNQCYDTILDNFHSASKRAEQIWKMQKGEKKTRYSALYNDFEGDFSRENVKKVIIERAKFHLESRWHLAQANIDQLEAVVKEFSREA